MKVPRRLVDDSELFAELVDDFRHREPPPKLLADVLQGMASHRDAAVSQQWRRIALALAGVGCVAALTGIAIVRAPNHEGPSAMTVADAPAVVSPPPVPLTSATEAVPSVSIDALPDSKSATLSRRAPVPPRVAAAPSSAPPPSSESPPIPTAPAGPSKPSVRREIELIAQARRALTRGDGRACLTALDLHDSEYPTGQFALEAKVMRVEATLAGGDRAGARALALEYLAKHPASPYDARVRSLLSSTEDR